MARTTRRSVNSSSNTITPMSSRIKIAAIVYQLPIPVHAGLHLVIHHMLRGLQERHDVQAFVLDKTYGPELADYFLPFRCYAAESPVSIPSVSAALSKKVTRVARYYSTTPEKVAWLQKSIGDYRPDVVIGFGYDLAPYFGLLQGDVPRVLDVVDSEILFLWRQIRSGEFKIATVKHLVAAVIAARRYLARCNALVAVSNEDSENIQRFSGNPHTFTINNGVDCNFFQPSTLVPKISGRIIFTGSLNWPPNQAAVTWFLRHCWNDIQQQRPDASLVVIGKLLTDDLRQMWEQYRNVQVIGFVPDIRAHILAAEVSIAPMVSGSGIKNKVLEAWALGQAVVATPLAVRGIKCEHETNLLIAETPDAFSGEVLRLLGDSGLQQRLGVNGRQNVLSNYSWTDAVAQYEQVILSTLAQPRF
jgi:glycosyltransferase involved in cell wall biosynthesis